MGRAIWLKLVVKVLLKKVSISIGKEGSTTVKGANKKSGIIKGCG